MSSYIVCQTFCSPYGSFIEGEEVKLSKIPKELRKQWETTKPFPLIKSIYPNKL